MIFARFGAGSFKAENYVKNRMIGETGRLNDRFTFAAVEQNEGRKALGKVERRSPKAERGRGSEPAYEHRFNVIKFRFYSGYD